MDDSNKDQRTVWCGNLPSEISEEILYELFLQAAPLERVCIPKDKDGKQNNFGFVTFKHPVSVQYAVELFDGTALFDRRINIKPRVPNLQRQNSHHRDHSPIPMQQGPPLGKGFSGLDVNMLMQMGDHLLLTSKPGSNNHDNYNRNPRSSPYSRWEHSNYRDDRRGDNRGGNYRRHNQHHSSDRHSSSSHAPYRGSKRYDR